MMAFHVVLSCVATSWFSLTNVHANDTRHRMTHIAANVARRAVLWFLQAAHDRNELGRRNISRRTSADMMAMHGRNGAHGMSSLNVGLASSVNESPLCRSGNVTFAESMFDRSVLTDTVSVCGLSDSSVCVTGVS